MYPLVSVIMPSYNGGKYIAQAIESILKQTYDNFELIIIEDCSTDNSNEIITKYMNIDSRIKLFVNKKNRGISYSTNKGINNAKGRYIALLDDDDIAVDKRLEEQVKYLEEHDEIDILGGRTHVIDEYGNFVSDWGQPRNNPKYIKAMLHFESVDFGNGSVMIRKRFIEKSALQYRDGCLGMQDFNFFIEASKVGKISAIDLVVLKVRMHDESETAKRKREYYQERKKLYACFQKKSLELSGFVLQEQELEVINRVLVEGKKEEGCSFDDWISLYRVFIEILRQAREMDIDYWPELKCVCEKKLLFVYRNISLF